jgi:hypothetical protein
LRETAAALARIESGRLHPATPAALAYAIVTAVVRGLRTQVSGVATTVAGLERAVMEIPTRSPVTASRSSGPALGRKTE